MPTSKPIILVAGALANKPHNGGEAWVRLSWVLGLQQLGYDVCFLEQVRAGVDPDALNYALRTLASASVARFSIFDKNGTGVAGLDPRAILSLANGDAILVNISGNVTWPELMRRPTRRAYVDLDPGYTQSWAASGGEHLAGHNAYFTVGLNVGRDDCVIPAGGICWRPLLPPVNLDRWPVIARRDDSVTHFTTVSSWRGAFGPAELDGRTYGLKCHEFRKIIDLPRGAGDTDASFEIALDIHPADAADRARLVENQWRLADPRESAGSADAFRRYVQESDAEFSVAQGVYVDTRSGWFSDRTAKYLASGKPALVQNTGIARHLPTGEGLITFSTLEEAIDGAQRITRDYDRHARAARAIAEEHLDSRKVLARFLEEIGAMP